MKCKYCNSTLAPLRSLIDGEFCCDEHRSAFGGQSAPRKAPAPPPEPIGTEVASSTVGDEAIAGTADEDVSFEFPSSEYLLPLQFETSAARPADCPPARFAEAPCSPAPPRVPRADLKIVVDPPPPQPVESEPAELPEMALPAESKAIEDDALRQAALDDLAIREAAIEAAAVEEAETPAPSLRFKTRLATLLHWPATAWRTATLDLRAVAILLPVLLSVAIGPSMPKAHVARAATAGAMQAMDTHWQTVKEDISKRAAIAVTDDFRAGLDAWDSRSQLTSTWSYDAAGFVQPGPLAILKPTTDLTDYRFEFLGEIDRRGMGCVFRARDLDNYYAMKFVEVKSGPLPLVHIVRYAVIKGKVVSRVEKPLPLTVRDDMLYRVMIDVHGNDFTIMAQGQVVDFFSDQRLKRGGVGFFCDRGEKARLRWVEVSHQYDALGRLCAYVAPYGLDAGN